MTKTKATTKKLTNNQVVALLKENQNARGIENWKKLGVKVNKLTSFGIGLTQLRKLAKQIGRDHKLAQQLWKSDIYDPKQLSREQAEEQVDELNAGMLSHVFAFCDATLAKAPFASELACDWMKSKDEMRQRCGYSLIYELSKKNAEGMDDDYYWGLIDHIRDTIHGEEMWVRESMKGALLGIGNRNKKLNKAAIRAVKTIGPVDVDYGDDNSCEPIDVLKHLTSDYLKQKLGT